MTKLYQTTRFSFCLGVVWWVFVFQSTNIHAQKYPLEMTSSQLSPVNSKAHEGSVSEKYQHLFAIIPILPLESFKLVVVAREDQRDLSYDQFSEDISLQETSQTFAIADFPEKLVLSSRQIGFLLNFGDSSLLYRHGEGITSDWKDISDQDHNYMNQVIFGVKTSASTTWVIGMAHRGGMLDDVYIPVVGYNYKGDTVHFRSALPSFMILKLSLGENWYVLLDESLDSNGFRLSEQAPWNNSVLSVLNLTSRIELGFRLFDMLEIGLSYGVVSHRYWTIFDEEKNELGHFDLEDATQASLQIQLAL